MNDKYEGLPQKFTTAGHVVEAARKGMRLRSIAARAGMSPSELQVWLEANPAEKLAYENAVADYEEDRRERIERYAAQAEAKGDWSLAYKIASERIKELTDRDNADRVVRVAVVEDTGLHEPEYVQHSNEELAAIRARTESEANRDE